jgi:hypothetical protein
MCAPPVSFGAPATTATWVAGELTRAFFVGSSVLLAGVMSPSLYSNGSMRNLGRQQFREFLEIGSLIISRLVPSTPSTTSVAVHDKC